MQLFLNLTCRPLTGLAAFAIATISLTSPAAAQSEPYFGDNSGTFANDGECDDVRFIGEGMADALITDWIGRDASDCRAAFNAEEVRPNPLFAEPESPFDIDYGDDKGEYANDGSCDDVRFLHSGSKTSIYLVDDIGHDASDCKAVMTEGLARWQANAKDIEVGITVGAMLAEDIAEDTESVTT